MLVFVFVKIDIVQIIAIFCLTDNEEVVGLTQVGVSDLNILFVELDSVDHSLVIGVDEPEEVL